MTQDTLTLYYSPGACSLAPHILLEEAGARFVAECFPIAEGAHQQPDYLLINPHGRVPTLRVGAEVVTENIAIMTYIAGRFPNAELIPADSLHAARVYEHLSFFVSSVHIAFAQLWRAERFADDATTHPAIQESGRRTLPGFFAEIEAMLEDRAFLVGHSFTAADTYPFIFHRWARRIGVEVDCYPAWVSHTRRLLARPSVQRALTREGLAGQEFVPTATIA